MGERPLRPPKTTRLGLSDELWAVIQSSLVSEVEERPTVSVFVDLLETANPDIALLEELTEFDATSEEHVRNLRYMLGYGDNTLLGMRAKEVLVVIEIFDRVRYPRSPPFLTSRKSLTPCCFRFSTLR